VEKKKSTYYNPHIMLYDPMAGQFENSDCSWEKSSNINIVEAYEPLAYKRKTKVNDFNRPDYNVNIFTQIPDCRKQNAFKRKESEIRKYSPMTRSKSVRVWSYNISSKSYPGGNVFFRIIINIGCTLNRWYQLLDKLIPWKK